MNDTIQMVMDNLRKNRIAVEYVSTKADVVPMIKSLIPEGATVGTGGSVSLVETGVINLLRNGNYEFKDRTNPDLTPEERETATRAGASADYFLCSSNAVTLNGELYNVDGNCNRISAIAYGPARVIMVVGINKIVPDLNAAVQRVKTIAAPRNTKRLNCDTYCHRTGVCMGLEGAMTDGCNASGRICCNYLVSAHQRHPNRITVILVGEECGY